VLLAVDRHLDRFAVAREERQTTGTTGSTGIVRRTIMKELFDELMTGAVSRRRFIERASAASLALIASSTEASAQGRPVDKPQHKDEQKPGEKLSPANIGGGGRVERNFYRDWVRESKAPMVEGYSIYDAKNQEVRPWPEIEGRGLYLNFSGNVHMDGVI